VRRIIIALIGTSAAAALVGGAVWSFRRNPRMGSSFVNSVVNPALLRRGLVGRGRAELATLEHFGRRSGRRYLTPVHPEPTPDGFQIMVPLGEHSEWARNVVAAGHCRLQLHDVVYQLDEPCIVRPTELPSLPAIARRIEDYLGFEYMTVREFSSTPGSLGEEVLPSESTPEPEPEVIAAT
jgi:hypothetical protein